MCGRFTLRTPAYAVADALGVTKMPSLTPRYNIAPTQSIPIVRGVGDRECAFVRWGLIPMWFREPVPGSDMINARAETVAEKPSFRAAFKRRRCLVPADGFYEWKAAEGRKRPHFIAMRDNRVFAIAGIWEHWHSPSGDEIESVALITTAANDMLRTVHDRMPAIIAPADFDLWLGWKAPPTEPVTALLRPYWAAEMAVYPVGFGVNNPKNDDDTLVEPVPLDEDIGVTGG